MAFIVDFFVVAVVLAFQVVLDDVPRVCAQTPMFVARASSMIVTVFNLIIICFGVTKYHFSAR